MDIPETLLHIFEFLEIKHLKSCLSVNREWNQLIMNYPLNKSIEMRFRETSRLLQSSTDFQRSKVILGKEITKSLLPIGAFILTSWYHCPKRRTNVICVNCVSMYGELFVYKKILNDDGQQSIEMRNFIEHLDQSLCSRYVRFKFRFLLYETICIFFYLDLITMTFTNIVPNGTKFTSLTDNKIKLGYDLRLNTNQLSLVKYKRGTFRFWNSLGFPSWMGFDDKIYLNVQWVVFSDCYIFGKLKNSLNDQQSQIKVFKNDNGCLSLITTKIINKDNKYMLYCPTRQKLISIQIKKNNKRFNPTKGKVLNC